MSVPITITSAGLAALINAHATGTAAITIAAIGVSATAITPDAAMTRLLGELYRFTAISGSVVSPDTIHVVMEDTSAIAYSALSFGLYLTDGTLFAIYGQSTPIYVKTADSIGLLAIDITLSTPTAASISFGNANFINPPATTTAMGVVQLATLAQAQAGADAVDVLTPATAKGAVIDWLLNQSVLLGVTDVETPNAGTSGGLRLRGNAVSGLAFLQVISPDATTEWGHWKHSVGGEADWVGGPLRRSGQEVWDSGNDGPGSGLDADLLDGQHGAYYADITSRLGYTPLNAAAYTPADVLAKLETVDGTGSGLDADLLDGQHGSFYARAADLASYVTLAYLAANIQALVAGVIAAVASAAGLSYYFGTNGYVRLPSWLGGVIWQWGKTAAFYGEGGQAISFPIAFPTACYNVQSTEILTSAGNTSNDQGAQVYNPTQTGMTVFMQIYGGGSSSFPCYAYWFAIGN